MIDNEVYVDPYPHTTYQNYVDDQTYPFRVENGKIMFAALRWFMPRTEVS